MVVRPMLNSKADLMAVLIIRNDNAYQWTNTLNWKHTFEKHDLGVLLGHELYYTNTSGTETAYEAFPDTNLVLMILVWPLPDTWKSSFFGRKMLCCLFGLVSIRNF